MTVQWKQLAKIGLEWIKLKFFENVVSLDMETSFLCKCVRRVAKLVLQKQWQRTDPLNTKRGLMNF